MSQIEVIREKHFPTSDALIRAREALIRAEPFLDHPDVEATAAELRAALTGYAAAFLVSHGVMTQ